MERSSRNFLAVLKKKKILAIFASPHKYFTESSRWVPLKQSSTQRSLKHTVIFLLLRYSSIIATDFFSMSSTVSSWTGTETADPTNATSRKFSAPGFKMKDPRTPPLAWVLR